jgi:hypothetical protein
MDIDDQKRSQLADLKKQIEAIVARNRRERRSYEVHFILKRGGGRETTTLVS